MQLEDKLYTSSEVANILGVSLRSVYRYLDEGTLHADVKTATGRHRFTRKNIFDFLYPDGNVPGSNSSSAGYSPSEQTRQQQRVSYTATAPTFDNEDKDEDDFVPIDPFASKEVSRSKVSYAEKEPEPVSSQQSEKGEEEEVDWLAKFREAAAKYRAEQEEKQSHPGKPEEPEQQAPVSEDKYESFDDIFSFNEPEPVEQQKPTSERRYYRSMLGGLKDIAQNIDKSARSADLPYAFTLNAGLSLHKPIKPFAILHAYIRYSDVDFFERSLRLTSSDESSAQLCLILTNSDTIFAEREEKHGLFVVSKSQMYEDGRNFGDASFLEEYNAVLS